MRVLCFAINDFIKDREKMNKVIAYGLNHKVSDIYLFSFNVISNSLLDSLDLIPKSGLKVHLFLSNQDRMRLSFSDYKKAADFRKDVDLISSVDLKMNFNNKTIYFINDQVTFDDEDLYEYDDSSDYEIFVCKNKKFAFSECINLEKKILNISLPSLSDKTDAVRLDIDKKEIAAFRINVGVDVAVKDTLFRL